MSPGCLLDAPVELVQRWLPHSISIRGSKNRVDLSSPLLFPSQMFDSSLRRAALFLCLSPPHTGLLQLISLSSPSAAQRAGAKTACSLGADTVYVYIYMLYRLFFRHPLCDRAGQNALLGLKLGLGGIPVKGQLVMCRSASNEMGCVTT